MQLISICTDQLSSHSRERSDVQYEQTPKKPAELLPVPKVILLSLVFGILVIFSEQLYNVLKCREWQCSEMYMCVGLGRSTTQEQLSVTGLKIPISVYVCTWVFTRGPIAV